MTAPVGTDRTVRRAVDEFLAVRRAASTTRAYTGTLDCLVRRLGPDRQLTAISSDELDAAVTALWGAQAPRTWNRQVATVRSWLSWCRRSGWLGGNLALSVDRRPTPNEQAKTIPLPELERLWSRRDIPLRERALWRLLYDSAGRAQEVLALDVVDVDLDSRRVQVHAGAEGQDLHHDVGQLDSLDQPLEPASDGHTRVLHFKPATGRLLGALIAGRDRGPVFLTTRRAAGGARAAADVDPDSGRARLSYERAEQLFKRYTGGRTLHQLHYSRLAHLGEQNVGAPLRVRRT